MEKICAGMLITSMILISVAGCSSETTETSVATTTTSETTVTETEVSEETTVTETTSEPEPFELEAVELASAHGLTRDDLRGDYELFIKYSESIENNDGLNGFEELAYQVFPVVSDSWDYLDEERFFADLDSLSIEVGQMGDDLGGQYSSLLNTIRVNEKRINEDPVKMPSLLYHEFMHFIDLSICNGNTDNFTYNGDHIDVKSYFELSEDEQANAVECSKADFIIEGGAEYIADKYFRGAPMAYPLPVCIMAGIDYVMGEDYVFDLYFSWDSSAKFEDLMAEIGYSHEDCCNINATLSHDIYPQLYGPVEDKASITDMLIDLYEYKLGDGWKNDAEFLYILKMVELSGDGIIGDSVRVDDYDLFKMSEEDYKKFEENLLRDIPEKPELYKHPALPFIKDGEFKIGTGAYLTDPDSGEEYFGVIIFDADLTTGERRSYSIIDYSDWPDKYFEL